ncbi:MAG TPA: methylated-DNA--[protein]-cysteine S-methyltransferase [Capsulimonadaceae bacterium]|jgi:methylated-DNA-[protein]-cysteine S-methyltransferase
MKYTVIQSPLGPLTALSDGSALTELWFGDESARHDASGSERDDAAPPFDAVRAQLRAYFDGTLTSFDLPLAPSGTEFQTRVWAELGRIPLGITISYGELAGKLGDPKGSRAVGLANGRNPIAIIVPCHRVIGANGKLTGYAGGIERKIALLDFERAVMSSGPVSYEAFAPTEGVAA